MFGLKKRSRKPPPASPEAGGDASAADPPPAPITPESFSRQGNVMSKTKNSGPPLRPEIPRRRLDIPGLVARPGVHGPIAGAEEKQLIVGRDICLSGEIKECDKLIVEGRVEAALTDAQSIEIAESGLFKGSAVVDIAEISGRFEGRLTARKRLIVHATGRVSGEIRYREIEVDGGGVVSGSVRTITEAEAEKAGASGPGGGGTAGASGPGGGEDSPPGEPD